MLNTFSFESWIMMNFEVEVGIIKHVKNISKCQAICSLIPPWLSFYVSFKWEGFLHQSCIYLKVLQIGYKFDLIWIYHEGVIHFRSWGKSLVQWYWPKMTYNVSSYHMHLKVEFSIPPNIKVEIEILNLIMPLE